MFGIIGFINLAKKSGSSSYELEARPNSSFVKFITSLFNNCIFIVASTIAIGELGDKTFLASLGLGLEYPNSKFSLILGSIGGMVASNFIAIFCGKLLGNHLKQEFIEFLSNITFIVFGLLGLVNMIF